MQERINNGDLVVEGNLIIDGFNYIVKGDLTVEGTVIIENGDLIVEGDLLIHSKSGIDVDSYSGGIYAKSITAKTNINIVNANISTFKDLVCKNIHCYGGDISVGGNSRVHSVYCRNYLIDGENSSLDIEANNAVYIMDFSNSYSITAPEVFLGGGGNFNGCDITANHFEFDGHITNCFCRHFIN